MTLSCSMDSHLKSFGTKQRRQLPKSTIYLSRTSAKDLKVIMCIVLTGLIKKRNKSTISHSTQPHENQSQSTIVNTTDLVKVNILCLIMLVR